MGRDLQEEVAALRAENAQLRRKIKQLQGKDNFFPEHTISELQRRCQNADMRNYLLNQRFALSYIYRRFIMSTLWLNIQKAFSFIRKYFLVAKLLKLFSGIVFLIETSATLFFVGIVFAVSLPFLILSTAAMPFLYRSRANRLLKEIENIKKLYVFSIGEPWGKKDCFYKRSICNIAESDDATVFFLTSDYYHNLFYISKQTQNNLYVMRPSFYIYLKKRLNKIENLKIIEAV